MSLILNPFRFGAVISTASMMDYWAMDEASGNRAGSFASLTLTDNATVTAATAKLGANAAQFTRANSEYLSRASEAAVQFGDIDFTIAAWVYLDSKTDVMSIVSKDGTVSGTREMNVYYDNTADRLVFIAFTATDVQRTVTANTFGAVATATWHYVLAWHDAAGDTINISINGGTADSTATTGALQAASSAEFRIGASVSGLYFNGRIDEVGIWKRVLAASERTALYNGGTGRAYPF